MQRLSLARSVRWLAAFPALAWAHAPHPGAWSVEPWAVMSLAAGILLYAIGVARLWRRAGTGRGISRADVARFAGGAAVLALALLPPIDTMSVGSFAAHMLQHELLMVVAAPILVLARPLEAWTWALAPAWRSLFARTARLPGPRAAWEACTEPMGAFTLHAIALWAWHIPALFEAALADPVVHAAQHLSFFGTALLFWNSVGARVSTRNAGLALASIFGTMLHTSALGALLTFAPTPWYGYHGIEGLALSPLDDQQLGGLVMWVPGGIAYVVAGITLVWQWLRRPEPALSG